MEKIITPLVRVFGSVMIGFFIGYFVHYKLYPIPDCKPVLTCPACPDVKVQSLDLDKIKRVKGNITINMNNKISVDCDSVYHYVNK